MKSDLDPEFSPNPSRDFILSSIFTLFRKKSVLGRLFRRSVFCIVFLSFFGRPGVPRNHENQAKPWYDCTKTRFSKNRKWNVWNRLWESFCFSFLCLGGSFFRFEVVFDLLVFGNYFECVKVFKRSVQDSSGYPVYLLKRLRQHESLALSLSKQRPQRSETPSACMCAGTMADNK